MTPARSADTESPSKGALVNAKDTRITIRIPRDLVDALDRKAKANDRSLSGELRHLVRCDLEKRR